MTRFLLQIDWPEWMRDGSQPDIPANFKAAMTGALRSVMEPFMEDVQRQTPDASIKQGYYLHDITTPQGVEVVLGNTAEHWQYREYDTKPGWRPWGPGTPLDEWAMAHGIPTFLVARKIAREGTKGNYIVTNAYPDYRERQQRAVQEALYAFVLSMGSKTSPVAGRL